MTKFSEERFRAFCLLQILDFIHLDSKQTLVLSDVNVYSIKILQRLCAIVTFSLIFLISLYNIDVSLRFSEFYGLAFYNQKKVSSEEYGT